MNRKRLLVVAGVVVVLYVMWAEKWPPALWSALHTGIDRGSTLRPT